MKKIAIVGSPGAGKSTFARELGNILGIEVLHLDKYYWQKNWQETPKDAWEGFQKYLVQLEQWIIDGTYLSTSMIRLEAADTIIFLDRWPILCLWRVIKRHFQYAKQPRPDFSESCLDRLNLQYIIKVFWTFPTHDRKELLSKIQAVDLNSQEASKYIITLSSKYEISHFLQDLREQATGKQQQTSSEIAFTKE